MRHYEMMVILSDTLDDEEAASLTERIEASVADARGEVAKTDFWGRRPFAYEINHRSAGYYIVFDIEVTADALSEIERQLRLNDDVVRFKSIRPDVRVTKPGRARARTFA